MRQRGSPDGATTHSDAAYAPYASAKGVPGGPKPAPTTVRGASPAVGEALFAKVQF